MNDDDKDTKDSGSSVSYDLNGQLQISTGDATDDEVDMSDYTDMEEEDDDNSGVKSAILNKMQNDDIDNFLEGAPSNAGDPFDKPYDPDEDWYLGD